MKKIVIVVSAVLLMISCKPEAPKDYNPVGTYRKEIHLTKSI